MTDSIDRAAQHLMETELLEGEELLWVGRPSATSSVTRQLPQAVFTAGIFIAILAIFMSMFQFRALAMPFANPIFGVMGLIVLVGIVAAVGGLLSRLLRARNTTYAITNRRVLIVEDMVSRRITSFGPDDLQRVERRDRGGGSGDIIFRYEPHVRHFNQAGWNQTQIQNQPIGFFGIDNVREVERLLISTFLAGDNAQPLKRKRADLADSAFEDFYAEYEDAIATMLPPEDPEDPAHSTRA